MSGYSNYTLDGLNARFDASDDVKKYLDGELLRISEELEKINTVRQKTGEPKILMMVEDTMGITIDETEEKSSVEKPPSEEKSSSVESSGVESSSEPLMPPMRAPAPLARRLPPPTARDMDSIGMELGKIEMERQPLRLPLPQRQPERMPMIPPVPPLQPNPLMPMAPPLPQPQPQPPQPNQPQPPTQQPQPLPQQPQQPNPPQPLPENM
jgi:hypothetical protein